MKEPKTRAEKAAMKEYPEKWMPVYDSETGVYLWDDDENAVERACFRRGYEQAEKDLALTVGDLERIVSIENKLFAEHAVSSWTGDEPYTPEYFAELLRRVNEAKENDHVEND